MDNNKFFPINQINPRVSIANYFSLKPSVRSWGPRTLIDFELILIRKGIYRYRESSKQDLFLNPHDLLIIPPFKEHKLELIDGNKNHPAIACIHNFPFSGDMGRAAVPDASPLYQKKTSLNNEDFTLMSDLFERSAELFNDNHPYGKELLSSLCRQIWLIAGAYWLESFTQPAKAERMDEMLRFIGENYNRPLTRHDLAREFRLAPEYINALFKKELAMTPTEVINREKIHRGYLMLHNEGLSVKETAYRCGFTDEYYFARLFKRILGISPGTVKGSTAPA